MKKDRKGGLRINLRLKAEEGRRFEAVITRIRARERGHIYESDVVRELMLVIPPNLLTDEDRLILAHGTDAPALLDSSALVSIRRKRKKAED